MQHQQVCFMNPQGARPQDIMPTNPTVFIYCLFYLNFKGGLQLLTPSRELTQPWCDSLP